MQTDIEKLAFDWITAPKQPDTPGDFYCPTRDIFQARHERMIRDLFSAIADDAYIIAAIAGEIGNNSYDHNIGNWRDMPGIFFSYAIQDNKATIAIADRGQGILNTLKKVMPSLIDDKDALKTAFTERISGRAPEKRGNGLKFVRENIEAKKLHLTFYSGNAVAELNDTMQINDSDQNIQGCLAVIRV